MADTEFTSSKQSTTFEELYLQQKKRASLFMISTIALALSTAGAGYWGYSQSQTGSATQTNSNMPGNFSGQGGFGGQFNGQGGPGGMRGLDVSNFFNDDGSVDTSAIEDITSRMPSGAGGNFLDIFESNIDQAVEDGDITQSQADALKLALSQASEDSNAN